MKMVLIFVSVVSTSARSTVVWRGGSGPGSTSSVVYTMSTSPFLAEAASGCDWSVLSGMDMKSVAMTNECIYMY